MVSFLGQQRTEKVKLVPTLVYLEDSLFVLLFAVKGIAKTIYVRIASYMLPCHMQCSYYIVSLE